MAELIARGILIRDSKLLLSRKHKDGYYALIGGHIEEETICNGLIREFKEETNLQVKIERHLYIIENTYKKEGVNRFEVVFYFLCKEIGGNFKDKREDATLKWMAFNKLKEIRILPPSLKKYLVHDLEEGFQRRTYLLKASKKCIF